MKINTLLLLMGMSITACVQEMGIVGHLPPYGSIDKKPIARQLPEHTIARGHLPQNPDDEKNQEVMTLSTLQRGQERYEIFCTPCHGISGFGNGAVVRRGFPAPPSFHQERLRMIPNTHLVRVIKNGFGLMYGFANVLDAKDAWAIAGYMRALQLSQNVKLFSLPLDQRNDILRELK